MSENWIPIIAILSVFGSTAYIGYLIVDGLKFRHRALQAREFQQKLLDRVGSAQDLSAVLNSEGTTRLLTSLGDAGVAGPHARILRATQSGVVLAVLGVALFLYVFMQPRLYEDTQQAISLIATIALALGVGLVGAGGAAYMLSRRMGILNASGQNHTTVIGAR